MDRAVSICSTGCICAAGKDTNACFNTLTGGKTVPTFRPQFSEGKKLASPVYAVDESWLEKRNEPFLTETMLLLFNAAAEACSKAGITPDTASGMRIGTCIGSSTGASLNFKFFYQQWKEGNNPDLDIIHSYLHSNPAACLAEHYGFNGPVQTVTNACSSGTDAIGIGASWIRQGLCDLVLAGGADALSSISHTGFSRLMITSPEPCRPFDAQRKGLNLGEGAAVLLLASPKACRELGLAELSCILGYGTCSDAHHLTAPHPQGLGLKTALSEAVQRSDIKFSDIDFINVHGTGTENNDRIEGLVLGEYFPGTPFTGIKGFTGHTLGAAGAVEAVMTVESLRHGKLMPCAGFQDEDPQIGVSPVHETTAIDADYAISDSLAFGGSNSVLVFRRGAE